MTENDHQRSRMTENGSTLLSTRTLSMKHSWLLVWGAGGPAGNYTLWLRSGLQTLPCRLCERVRQQWGMGPLQPRRTPYAASRTRLAPGRPFWPEHF